MSAPCWYCGAARSCNHREVETETSPVVDKIDKRKLGKSGNGLHFRINKRNKSLKA